jgi:hypothetical protein
MKELTGCNLLPSVTATFSIKKYLETISFPVLLYINFGNNYFIKSSFFMARNLLLVSGTTLERDHCKLFCSDMETKYT